MFFGMADNHQPVVWDGWLIKIFGGLWMADNHQPLMYQLCCLSLMFYLGFGVQAAKQAFRWPLGWLFC